VIDTESQIGYDMIITKCEESEVIYLDKVAIGSRLKELRGDKSQNAVASAVGVLQSTYCMYETGQRIPSDEVKKRIADYFHKSVQEIFFA
jgi:DNA-binding XRE family transcriptional regulator